MHAGIRFAAITHIYVAVFTKRDAQKCERGVSVCQPGGYNLCLTGLVLDQVQVTGLRAGFCLPSCSSLMPFLCFSSSKGSNSALSYIWLKIEDSSLGKVICVQDISSGAFVWSPCSFLLFVLFGLPQPVVVMDEIKHYGLMCLCTNAQLLIN